MKTKPTQHIDTRTALLECADKLFLVHGLEGVSVRQITQNSGANVASVNYHFNGKTGLFREVLARHLERITGEKLALLKELAALRPAPGLETVLDVYIRSFFDAHMTGPESDRLMQIIFREMGPDAVASDLVADRLVKPINQAFKELLLSICPDLDEKQASLCVSSVTGQILHFIRGREILRTLRNDPSNQAFIEEVIHHITQFSLRGIGGKHYV